LTFMRLPASCTLYSSRNANMTDISDLN
jgi:hypothetical protein